MRAIWSAKQNCSHNVSQKLKRIRRFSDDFQKKCVPSLCDGYYVCMEFLLVLSCGQHHPPLLKEPLKWCMCLVAMLCSNTANTVLGSMLLPKQSGTSNNCMDWHLRLATVAPTCRAVLVNNLDARQSCVLREDARLRMINNSSTLPGDSPYAFPAQIRVVCW